MNDDLKLLTIIPGLGWDNGVNLQIVNEDITSMNDDDVLGPRVKATKDTLIVKIRDMVGLKNCYYLGFLPEEGVFALVPAWIFWEARA